MNLIKLKYYLGLLGAAIIALDLWLGFVLIFVASLQTWRVDLMLLSVGLFFAAMWLPLYLLTVVQNKYELRKGLFGQ